MNRRGQALPLILVILAMLTSAWMVYQVRQSTDTGGRRDTETRSQALWLARSALDAGFTGDRDVQTAHGMAHVQVRGGVAEVELEGARATVQAEPYVERFEGP